MAEKHGGEEEEGFGVCGVGERDGCGVDEEVGEGGGEGVGARRPR